MLDNRGASTWLSFVVFGGTDVFFWESGIFLKGKLILSQLFTHIYIYIYLFNLHTCHFLHIPSYIRYYICIYIHILYIPVHGVSYQLASYLEHIVG